jgi:hypothetical protein
VKKKTSRFRPFPPLFFYRYANLFWGGLAVVAWVFEQVIHAQQGEAFSIQIFLKGLLLLSGATAVYYFSTDKRGFSFLGLFPLLWLSVSKFQWDLCLFKYPFWLWLALFMTCEVVISVLADGKKLLFFLAPLWAFLAWLLPFSFFLPLTFVTAPKNRLKRATWVRWGGLLAGVFFFVVFRGWVPFHFVWVDLFDFLYDFLARDRYISFFLLGWLGLIAFSERGTFRHRIFPMFLLLGGFMFWTGSIPMLIEIEILKWVLVFMAGFGLESFRRDLMDQTWHGRMVWAAFGLAFFGGVF